MSLSLGLKHVPLPKRSERPWRKEYRIDQDGQINPHMNARFLN